MTACDTANTNQERITSIAPNGEGERDALFLAILQRYWGYPSFRGIQHDIITSIYSGCDTLGLMPTGGGKSLTFQVPAMAKPGLCLVVTPLIALMKDQVQNLRRRGILAAAVYAGMPRERILQTLDNAVLGAYKFLYVSPERLATPIFVNKVARMNVSMLCVDEAHCISQWGYDFRPDYLRIADIRKAIPHAPVLALTATATQNVARDIQKKLHFRQECVFQMSFARQNLRYVVRHTGEKYEELLHILRSVSGSAIVYTRNRRATAETAERLEMEGISAFAYHAGLTSLDKDVRQRAWQHDEVRVMVATNAFGMGIDKPDVRLVVHLDVPDSIEAYFQEAGRAGRDGKPAYAVLLADRFDATRLSARIPQTYPQKEYIRKVYEDLASFFQVAEGEADGRTFEMDVERFCRTFHHYPVTLLSALAILTRAGYIQFLYDGETNSRMRFVVQREDLYHIDLESGEERVLNALMRMEGGFFADYVPVEEDRIGEECHMTAQEVYEKLRRLTQKHIIHYIPHRNTPQVTYTMRRLDTRYVEIPPEVYEQRLEQYRQRIDAMISYFTRDDQCRSRALLHYFGEKGDDCGGCDVCIARRQAESETHRPLSTDETAALILQQLQDGAVHALHELLPEVEKRETLQAALAQLLANEQIAVEGDKVRRK